MHEIIDQVNSWVGKDIREVTMWQIAVRSVFCYVFTILAVRFGNKRFLGQSTAFDAVLGFILGSVVSRAINGTAPFVQTLVATALLVVLHYLLATIVYAGGTRTMGLFLGDTGILVKDGKIQHEIMRRHHITEADLMGALRQWGNVDDVSLVECAVLERSGLISCVLKKEFSAQLPLRG